MHSELTSKVGKTSPQDTAILLFLKGEAGPMAPKRKYLNSLDDAITNDGSIKRCVDFMHCLQLCAPR